MKRLLAMLCAAALVAAACGGDDPDPTADDADATPTATAAVTGDAGESSVLVITDARYRVAREGLGAAYMVITNSGDEPALLSAATSPAAGRVEIHETVADEDGLMGMVEVPEGFEIPADGELVLEPGGKHLMLIDLAGDAGDVVMVDVTLDDTVVTIPFAYSEELSAMPGHDHGDHDHGDEDHDHGDMDHDHGDEDHDHGDMDHDHGDEDHDHDHGDEEHDHGAAADPELTAWLDGLDIEALHGLDDDIAAGVFDPTVQLPVAAAALRYVTTTAPPADVDESMLEAGLVDLVVALGLGDADAAAAAALMAHDAAHALEPHDHG